MSLRIYAASKNQPETVGMVIKNQNTLYSFARRICCRWGLSGARVEQAARFLDNKNLLCTRAGPSARRAHRKRPRQMRLMIAYGSNEWRGERHLSALKAFPLHKVTLWQTVACRHGARAGFWSPTCEVILTPSFEIDQSSPALPV
jgi:hypothetical protein